MIDISLPYWDTIRIRENIFLGEADLHLHVHACVHVVHGIQKRASGIFSLTVHLAP